MEYVVVTYPEERPVVLDGHENGVTNETLLVEEGTHAFSLGGPADFSPGEQVVQVTGTSAIKPQQVAFTQSGGQAT